MSTTDTDVQNLVVNKLTLSQYTELKNAGTVSATESYEITDIDSKILDFYGTCTTAAGTQAKVVTCPGFILQEGISIRVKFTNNQDYNGAPTLNVNNTGAKTIVSKSGTNAIRYCWMAGEVVAFTYDGTNWIMQDGGIATTTYYGVTKLQTSTTSTGTGLAATPASINNLVQNMIEPYDVYSTTGTYAVGDRVRYNNNAWECNTAISTAEAWTEAHWTKIDPIQIQLDDLSVLDNNAVKLNGNQTINDVKTFTSPIPIDTSADDGRVVTKLENITLGTDPTINAYGGFKTVDSNDVQFANCNCSYSTTGKIGCNFWISRSDSGTAVSGTLGIYIDKNGTSAYTQAPTPDVSANNTEIATTAYINTKFQVVSTLPASPDANTYYFIPAS